MFIDLTVTLNQHTPVYPGDPAIIVEPAGVLERDGWNDHQVTFGTHIGTHIDAPIHMLADGKTLDKISIEQFIGRGRLIDVTSGFNLEKIQQVDIQPGDIVLFHTGMSEHYHEPVYFETYPVMPEETVRYMVKRGVKMVGVDAGSVDSSDGSGGGFPIHTILLAGNVLIIENLTNLNQLTGKEFTVYALPIKLDVDGAPARVIAEVTV